MRGLEEEMVGVIFLVRRLFNERGDGGRGVATWAGRGGAGPVMTVVAVSSEWPSAVTTGVPSSLGHKYQSQNIFRIRGIAKLMQNVRQANNTGLWPDLK